MGQWRYSSTFLTLEVAGGGFTPLPLYPQVRSPPSPLPIGQEDGWAPESVWTLWRREKSCTAGNQTQAIQPIASLYTDFINIHTKLHLKDLMVFISN
jgi:hypothetical protein